MESGGQFQRIASGLLWTSQRQYKWGLHVLL
jgi:hypothetical protein